MGVVYKARDTRLDREVALKVLNDSAGVGPEAEGRLRREAQAAARLAHPAISVVYEIDDAEDATFISMELVRGRPLAALLAEAPLEPARALDLALEVAGMRYDIGARLGILRTQIALAMAGSPRDELLTTLAETLAEAGRRAGRSVCLLGRAMRRMIEAAVETGVLTDFPGTVSPEDAIAMTASPAAKTCGWVVCWVWGSAMIRLRASTTSSRT